MSLWLLLASWQWSTFQCHIHGQVSIERYCSISNQAFSGSMLKQQQYVCTNTKVLRVCALTCTLQLNLLSMWIPNDLYNPNCLMVWSLITTGKCTQIDLGSNIISLIFWLFSSRKLSVHHSVNWFTSGKYVSMLLGANSWLRIAESSVNHLCRVCKVMENWCICGEHLYLWSKTGNGTWSVKKEWYLFLQ